MRFLVPLLLALNCVAAAAQLYSWKDAEGKTHYSDEPPPGKTPSRKLKPPPSPPPAAPATAGKTGEKDPAAKKAGETPAKSDKEKAAEAAAKAEKEKAEAEVRRVNCDRARSRMAALEAGNLRFTLNTKGERVALEGDVLQAELGNARKSVEGWCN